MLMKRTLLPLLATAALTASLHAQVMMLDFGPTVAIDDAGDANSLTNSPYHAVNTGFTQTTWNQVLTADIGTGNLKWADGSTATGISLNLGATTTATSTTIGLSNTPSGSNALGSATNTGVYAATSVAKDGIFTGTTTGGLRAVGFQITGLAPGTYDIYITARNTNTSVAHVQNLYAASAASTGDFNFASYQTQQLNYTGGSDGTSAWVAEGAAGENYVKLSVTLTALNPYLNLASFGGTGEVRGFLNSVQIVSTIPEPSSYGALLGAGTLGMALLRRKSFVRRA